MLLATLIIISGVALEIATNSALPSDPVKPVPLNDPATWVSADDYPEAALRAEQEGHVLISLKIGRDGVPSSCHVDESSGSPSLDGKSCEVLMTRARFAPPKDQSGNPTTAILSRTINWLIPKLPEGNDSLAVQIRAEGDAYRCETQIDGKPRRLTAETCKALTDSIKKAGRDPIGLTRVVLPRTPRFIEPEA